VREGRVFAGFIYRTFSWGEVSPSAKPPRAACPGAKLYRACGVLAYPLKAATLDPLPAEVIAFYRLPILGELGLFGYCGYFGGAYLSL
jgi:hypothetical protein